MTRGFAGTITPRVDMTSQRQKVKVIKELGRDRRTQKAEGTEGGKKQPVEIQYQNILNYDSTPTSDAEYSIAPKSSDLTNQGTSQEYCLVCQCHLPSVHHIANVRHLPGFVDVTTA